MIVSKGPGTVLLSGAFLAAAVLALETPASAIASSGPSATPISAPLRSVDDHSRHQSTVSTPPASKPDSGSDTVRWFPGGRALFAPAYYDSFANIDLTSLTAEKTERFLHWVNVEYCTCGQGRCRRDTIANCYTHDSQCPRAPVRLREILERVKKGDLPPGPSKAGSTH